MLLIVVISVGVLSCKKTRKDLIQGKWELKSAEFDPQSVKHGEDTIDIYQALKTEAGLLYQFKEDGTFNVSRKETVTQNGKYEFKNEDKYLLLNYGGNVFSRFLILQLDKNWLKLRLEDGAPILYKFTSVSEEKK
jgi:hypothetical protein